MILYHFRKLATVLLINLQTMFDCFPATLKLFYHNAVIATISSEFRYKSLKIERVFHHTNGVPGSWMAFPLKCLACVEAWHWDRGSQAERRERGRWRDTRDKGRQSPGPGEPLNPRSGAEDSSAQQPAGAGGSPAMPCLGQNECNALLIIHKSSFIRNNLKKSRELL